MNWNCPLFLVCGGTISGQSEGSISTPSYPSNYGANLTCEWTITVDPAMNIKVDIRGFETEHPDENSDCTTVDYLEVSINIDISSGRLRSDEIFK